MRGRSTGVWWGTALEAPDPAALAAFYSSLLDWPVVHTEPGPAIIKPPQDSVFMAFQLAAPQHDPDPLPLGRLAVSNDPGGTCGSRR